MQGCLDNHTEYTLRALATHRLSIEEYGKTLELALALLLHSGEKGASVDEVESGARRVACRHEIDRGRYGGRGGEYVLRPPALAEPLEKHIAAERHANCEKRRAGRFTAQAPKDPADLLRIARVIGPRQSVRFAGATAKVRHGAAPGLLPELARKSTSVMAARVALEAVKEHNERSIGWTCQTIDIDEVAVRRVPAFPLPTRLGTADQHAVQGLQVCAGQPPGSSVGA